MIERPVRICNDLGLHLRAAGILARTASRFECEVTLRRGSQSANAKSIMGLLALAAGLGTELSLITSGSDEALAADTLSKLIEAGFVE